MRKFVKGLHVFLLAIEIFSAVLICLGFLFRAMTFSGANELLLLGFTILVPLFFLRAMIPFYKRYLSTSPSMSENLALIVRRVVYISMALYATALAFLSQNFVGREEMMIIGFSAIIATSFVSIVLLARKKERMAVFSDVAIRTTCLFLAHMMVLI